MFSFVTSPDYLTRQAACRALPAVLPVTSICLHLELLPDLLETETDTNCRCGLIELAEVYLRFLGCGEAQTISGSASWSASWSARWSACERLARILPGEKHSLVRREKRVESRCSCTCCRSSSWWLMGRC